MSGENWTPRVGDRVRVPTVPSAGTFALTDVDDIGATGEDGLWWIANLLELVEAARPIAYVKQARPDVDFDLRTPYQQRGWAP